MTFLVYIPQEVLYGSCLRCARITNKQHRMFDLDHLFQ